MLKHELNEDGLRDQAIYGDVRRFLLEEQLITYIHETGTVHDKAYAEYQELMKKEGIRVPTKCDVGRFMSFLNTTDEGRLAFKIPADNKPKRGITIDADYLVQAVHELELSDKVSLFTNTVSELYDELASLRQSNKDKDNRISELSLQITELSAKVGTFVKTNDETSQRLEKTTAEYLKKKEDMISDSVNIQTEENKAKDRPLVRSNSTGQNAAHMDAMNKINTLLISEPLIGCCSKTECSCD